MQKVQEALDGVNDSANVEDFGSTKPDNDILTLSQLNTDSVDSKEQKVWSMQCSASSMFRRLCSTL